MKNCLVSVLTTSYNNAHFIVESPESVKEQDCATIELIIVDDVSIDDSVKVINSWVESNGFKRKTIVNKLNIRVYDSKKLCLTHTSGKYTSWLLSDYVMLRQKRRIRVEVLDKLCDDIDVMYGDAYMIGSVGNLVFSKFIQYYHHFVNISQGNIFFRFVRRQFYSCHIRVMPEGVFVRPNVVFTNDIHPHGGNDDYTLQLTLVQSGASLGTNSTILAGITIGRYALTGIGTVVTRDVPAHALVYGNPARRHGWVDGRGEKLLSSAPATGQWHSLATGRQYRETPQGLKPVVEALAASVV